MKKRNNEKKVTKALEDSLAGCMRVIVPVIVVLVPLLVILGFVVVQINHMYSGDWASVEKNLYFVGTLIGTYILGSAPKEGLFTNFMSK